MKTIFTFLTSLLVSISLLAGGVRPKSTLTIRSSDRGSIRVVIDGRRFEPRDNYMRIRGIDAGYHTIRIFRQRNNGFFNMFNSRYEMVFNKSVRLRPQTNMMIFIDRFGRATVNESRRNGWGYGRDDRDYGYGSRDNRGFGNNDDKRFDGNDKDFENRDGNIFDESDNRNWDKNHDFDFDRDGTNDDYNNDRDGKWGNKDPDKKDYNDYGYNQTMTDIEFNRVLESIQKEWFESNKAKSATQIITTNYFSTVQVKQLLQLFSFENTKLDLAKQAYGKTVDQRNYFMINDVFSFSSSKEELARYIREYR